jgi:hypothetical protein
VRHPPFTLVIELDGESDQNLREPCRKKEAIHHIEVRSAGEGHMATGLTGKPVPRPHRVY